MSDPHHPQGQPPHGQEPHPEWTTPYGQQPGGYGQPGHQPYGPAYGHPQQPHPYAQNPYGPPHPQPARKLSGGRIALIIALAAVVAAILVVLLVSVALLTLSSSTTEVQEASGTSMSVEGMDAVQQTLTETGPDWTCYDSVPGSVSRCFYYVKAGDIPDRATLTFGYDDESVVSVAFRADGAEELPEVREQVVDAVAVHLLDGDRDGLEAALGGGEQLEGVYAYGSGGYLTISTSTGERLTGPDLPQVAEVVASLRRAGFTCEDPADTTTCEKTTDGLRLQASGYVGDSWSSWTVSASPEYGARPTKQRANELVGQTLEGAGLTDDAGVAFLASAQRGQAGDFAGYALGADPYDGGSGYFTQRATVEVIR
ncbi:hypothetical protein CLV56_3634 [Mumia flava]|uniref:Uncharacterized protein n=1 Tax=Mumia flava TaxID=1348852 RepID=A0A2M9B859_9ACTN|nr:hypothetical protein [Mumia flava]PJJ54130.1 hypothetical protein CLV56_3634 [Mumia flava]